MKYYIRKEYPPCDTHCFGKDEPYQVIVDENGNKIGDITEEAEYSDTHCIGGNKTTTHPVINIFEPAPPKQPQKNNNDVLFELNSEPKGKSLSLRLHK